MNQHDVDIDPPCIRCGLRQFSGCTCPKADPAAVEKELGRRARMTRAELAQDGRARR